MTWPADVLDFWFTTLSPKDWYGGGPALDARIRDAFGDLHAQVVQAADDELLVDADTALAAIIVLDQMSRNLGRKSAAAFAHDTKALRLTKAAVARAFDSGLSTERRNFLYMPFMHSEVLEDHDRSIALFAGTKSEAFAHTHRDIIVQFGRYPYRNAVLGRESTNAELLYLKTAETFGQ